VRAERGVPSVPVNVLHVIVEPLTLAIYPAGDVPGQWIAHCLECDLVSQGDSVDEAQRMLKESMTTLVAYNVSHGLAPLTFRLAPLEIWRAVGATPPESIEVRTVVQLQAEPPGSGRLNDDDAFSPRFQAPIVKQEPISANAG
jgi:hypothetical protein